MALRSHAGSTIIPGDAVTSGAHFSWTEWHLHPDVLLLVLILAGLYLAAWRIFGRDYHLPRTRIALYFSGLAALYLGAGTPIHELSENYLYSMHMVQHLLFTLAAPPLLLAGTRDWMWRPLLRDRWVKRVARLPANPIMALALFNATLVISHLPSVVDLTLRNHPAHFFAHLILVLTAVIMWWQIYSPLPELPRLRVPGQMIYLFLQSMLPAIVASFITFSSSVVYDFYATVPRLWIESPVHDQQMAGLIMKLAGTTILWGVISVRFFTWYSSEESTALGLTGWQETEEELERMGLTKHEA